MEPIRVLAVDDSPVFLVAIRQLLQTEVDIELVACVRSAREAMDRIVVLQPDLILMDVQMPDMDGVEATRRIKALMPRTRVLVLTLSDHPAIHEAALRAGADAFLGKVDASGMLLPMIFKMFGRQSWPDRSANGTDTQCHGA